MQQKKELDRIDARKRKQQEQMTKIRRELRRQAHYRAQTQQSQLAAPQLDPLVSLEPLDTTMGEFSNISPRGVSRIGSTTSFGANPEGLSRSTSLTVQASGQTIDHEKSSALLEKIKRRTSLPPRKHVPKPVRGHSRNGADGNGKSTTAVRLQRSATVGGATSSSMYKGTLNQTEIAAGYGMGMAVSGGGPGVCASGERSISGIFSAVTGMKRSESFVSGAGGAVSNGGGSFQRSFSHASKKRFTGGSSSSSSSSSSSLSFLNANTNVNSASGFADENSSSSRHGASLSRNASHQGVVSSSASMAAASGNQSLFAKLGRQVSTKPR